ncbi:MAG: YbhB/YbcL family Raf kinase inhibitor-like protein [Methanospirillum sp.]|nr:YbhB/YbcL family Raf kinase inhibitor-like protein [Methanospirillum sp.]
MDKIAVQLDGPELGDQHTCRGQGITPRIRLGPLDPRVRSLAVVVIDPFEPGCSFALWLAAGIPPVPVIPAGLEPGRESPVPVVHGTNDGGTSGWQPPCPKPGDPPHQLTFKVYALDHVPLLSPGFSRAELNEALRGHILQFGTTIALVR